MPDLKQVRTRLAPSPTGLVHIGTVRTGLFNFLYARKNGGQFILRVEDTDRTRFVEGAMENMIEVVQKLGINFDEGPVIQSGEVVEKGDYGPYIQSKRLDIYKNHIEELISKQAAYYCFCTTERLAELRREQMALKKPAMYDRHCRNLSDQEIKVQLDSGIPRVVRQAIPLSGETVIHDLVYGDIKYEHATIDDQVLLKSDGFPTYHLAVVVDDHHMAISHVIRGEEWIPSTPKHILLYQSFGWDIPAFAHIPLILNPDKSKLSKRQGDVAAEEYLQKGYLPEALVNFIAFLGWNPKSEQEFFTMQELIAEFSLDKINKGGAVLDINKLDWVNSHYLRNKSNAELVELAKPYWEEQGIDVSKFKSDYLEAIIQLEKERLKKLSEISDRTKYFFEQPKYDAALLNWKKSTPEDAKQKLTLMKDFVSAADEKIFSTTESFESSLKAFIAEHEFDNGSVLWPLRVALTGQEKSPGPFELVTTLYLGWGKQGIIERIETAIAKL